MTAPLPAMVSMARAMTSSAAEGLQSSAQTSVSCLYAWLGLNTPRSRSTTAQVTGVGMSIAIMGHHLVNQHAQLGDPTSFRAAASYLPVHNEATMESLITARSISLPPEVNPARPLPGGSDHAAAGSNHAAAGIRPLSRAFSFGTMGPPGPRTFTSMAMQPPAPSSRAPSTVQYQFSNPRRVINAALSPEEPQANDRISISDGTVSQPSGLFTDAASHTDRGSVTSAGSQGTMASNAAPVELPWELPVELAPQLPPEQLLGQGQLFQGSIIDDGGAFAMPDAMGPPFAYPRTLSIGSVSSSSSQSHAPLLGLERTLVPSGAGFIGLRRKQTTWPLCL